MLAKKIRQKGIYGTVRAILRRIDLTILRLMAYHELKKLEFKIDFKYEGSIIVRLPQASFLESLLNIGGLGARNADYSKRPSKEVLLRRIVFELYQTGYIDNTCSIIDIGSYIADNSIVWAQFLSGAAKVIAIDPSSKNIQYSKIVAEINGVRNINFVQSVCAEAAGIKLDFDGSIDHTSFRKSVSDTAIESTTIDEIIYKDESKVGFFHIDVEGFEFEVILGSQNVIKRDLPVIIFEQHISKEKVSNISEYLNQFGYQIFIINEVLPECDLDCRNFLAIPPDRDVPKLSTFEQFEGRKLGIYNAIIGDPIIAL